jgi:D12 class N6 adenine-specific DNA methyltransferase
MGKAIEFGWYGGKFNHLNWLLPLLPKATHYCEPFAGSAAVLPSYALIVGNPKPVPIPRRVWHIKFGSLKK